MITLHFGTGINCLEITLPESSYPLPWHLGQVICETPDPGFILSHDSVWIDPPTGAQSGGDIEAELNFDSALHRQSIWHVHLLVGPLQMDVEAVIARLEV